ncbi:hypothetical protein DFJ43DRAFT_567065 [Lentinula guzmanii]|uniref:Uncharacterized protein n=1 Tax=Lentinula guzmanii TaxID=2804957 RepID=A0AA38JBW9_9AGAR|nr:hypothetical protein DFJ43DRAFT_567065 [Lentinula guzmanii]
MASNERGGGKRRLSKKEQEIIWISSQDTLDAIARLSEHDYEEAKHSLLLSLAKYTRDGPHDWDSFFRHIGAAKVVLEDAEINRVLDDSHLCYAQWRLQSKPASHQWKRRLILNLGLNFRPYSIKGAIKQGLSSFRLPCGVVLQLIRRDPTERPKFLSYHHMYDLPGDHMREGGKVVNGENGFLIVQELESVLFYSGVHLQTRKLNSW